MAPVFGDVVFTLLRFIAFAQLCIDMQYELHRLSYFSGPQQHVGTYTAPSRVFPSGGTGGFPPMSLMSPLIRTVSPPIKSESCPPSSLFIMGGDWSDFFFDHGTD